MFDEKKYVSEVRDASGAEVDISRYTHLSAIA